MYLSIMGKPTNEELVKYPSVYLTKNGTHLYLITVILRVMGSHYGPVIHST